MDFPAFRRRQAGARAQGRYLGIVALFTGQMPHGQRHQTTLAQIAADEFGVRIYEQHWPSAAYRWRCSSWARN